MLVFGCLKRLYRKLKPTTQPLLIKNLQPDWGIRAD